MGVGRRNRQGPRERRRPRQDFRPAAPPDVTRFPAADSFSRQLTQDRLPETRRDHPRPPRPRSSQRHIPRSPSQQRHLTVKRLARNLPTSPNRPALLLSLSAEPILDLTP